VSIPPSSPATPSRKLIFLINFLLFISPFFLVTIRGLTNIIFAITAILCIVFSYSTRKEHLNCTSKNMTKMFIASFLLPFFSVALSSLLRGSFDAAQFDTPLRFLMAIPIFAYILKTRWNTTKYLSLSLFLSLTITLIQQYAIDQPMRWGSDRMATYFADPLVFGYIALTFSLVCLASIRIFEKETYWLTPLKTTGFLIGIYLSIKSGSRTGWAALPLILPFIFFQKKKNIKINAAYLATIAISLIAIFICFSLSTVGQRIFSTGNDIAKYHLDGIAPDTSTGLRITFLRIAWDLFSIHPFSGYGETKYLIKSLPPTIYDYASEGAISTALVAGFHNELVTNGVRYGIIGLVASASLFAVPLIIFLRTLKSQKNTNKANALIGFVFVMCIFISSISTEVFDLKYIASFYAMTVAMLCGSALAQYEQE